MKRGDLQSGSTAIGILFIIAAQASVASPTAKNLFDEPPFALHTKAFLLRLFGSNLQSPSKFVLHLSLKIHSTKAFIGPNQGEVAAPRGGFDFGKQK